MADKILIVEDNPSTRETLEVILKRNYQDLLHTKQNRLLLNQCNMVVQQSCQELDQRPQMMYNCVSQNKSEFLRSLLA